jgi:hypothetical protein
VANTLNSFPHGASLLAKAFGVGFIDWLGACVIKTKRLNERNNRINNASLHSLLALHRINETRNNDHVRTETDMPKCDRAASRTIARRLRV